MSTVFQPASAAWRKSSRSANNGACVEVAPTPDGMAVRDSKDPAGPVLVFDAPAWQELIETIKDGRLTGR